MNKKMKLGLTMVTAGALVFSSVAAFADTSALGKGTGGILDLMLKDGVVTQAQIDTYQAKAEANHLETLKANIQALVTNGTLTQAKADAVYQAVLTDQATRKAEHDQMAFLTKEEMDAKKAEMEAARTAEKAAGTTAGIQVAKKASAVSALVDSGTLTTAEYDAVEKVVGGGHGGPGDMRGGKGMRGEKPGTSTTPANTTGTTTGQ